MIPAPAITLTGRCEMAGRTLFGPLTLDMPSGEWTALLGPSGVGKSTILRLLAGLDIGGRFEGTILADDGGPLAGRVSFMAQSDLLFPWLDVLGNACLGARLRGERADIARATTLIAKVGLSAQIDQRPETLSGGERQRVALVRTMMEDRPVILLDEPFSALDAGTRAEMQELAADLFAGRTVLLVTHDPGEAARLADHLFILDKTGFHTVTPPPSRPVRALDDPDMLACQVRLLTRLRGAA